MRHSKVIIALVAIVSVYLIWRAVSRVEGFEDEAKDAAFKERMQMLAEDRDSLKASGDGAYLSDPGPLSDAYTIMASYCN
jgi:membrane protein implicated in regulation of membrane protease activity